MALDVIHRIPAPPTPRQVAVQQVPPVCKCRAPAADCRSCLRCRTCTAYRLLQFQPLILTTYRSLPELWAWEVVSFPIAVAPESCCGFVATVGAAFHLLLVRHIPRPASRSASQTIRLSDSVSPGRQRSGSVPAAGTLSAKHHKVRHQHGSSWRHFAEKSAE